jgi:hypothetical protein
MVGRTLTKGLVVIALTSQMAFGASYYEAVSTTVKNAGSAVKTTVVTVAQNSYEASKNAAISAGKAVATKAHDVRVVSGQALGKISDGFVDAGLIINGGVTRFWVNNQKACVAGLTLTGVAAVYAIYKYRKACAAQRQLEELKKQGYVKA